MIKTDCDSYAINAKGTPSCNVLMSLSCFQRPCKFYKTEQQANADRKASYERRKQLGGPFTEFDAAYIREDKKCADT